MPDLRGDLRGVEILQAAVVIEIASWRKRIDRAGNCILHAITAVTTDVILIGSQLITLNFTS